jgi:hypothetical protein
MIPPYCLIGWQPCGCMGIALAVDPDTDRRDITSVIRKIKRRGLTLEELPNEEAKARPWECSEHKALGLRLAAEKAGRR